jgi:hypothetical protein
MCLLQPLQYDQSAAGITISPNQKTPTKLQIFWKNLKKKTLSSTVGNLLLIEEITRLRVTKTVMKGLRPPYNS